jgi:hypothetical protein
MVKNECEEILSQLGNLKERLRYNQKFSLVNYLLELMMLEICLISKSRYWPIEPGKGKVNNGKTH